MERLLLCWLLVCSCSSHGFSDSEQAWIMPADGLRRRLVETAVNPSAIKKHVADSKAGHRLLLVNACQERVSVRGGAVAGTPAAIRVINARQKAAGQAKVASCSPEEFSFEHNSFGSVGHGVFALYFLEALRGAAPADQDNIVRQGTVADYVARGVGDWTGNNKGQPQTPFLQSPLTARELPLAARADELSSRQFARIMKPDPDRLLSGTPTPTPTPITDATGITRSAVSNAAAEHTHRFCEFKAQPAPPSSPAHNSAAF